MDKHDQRVFPAGLDFGRRHQPALNVRTFVCPLDAFGFAPARLQTGVVIR